MSKPGLFITLEGIEGVGKTTVAHLLVQHLQSLHINVIQTREPGGTPLAENLRQLLLDNQTEKIWPETELLMFFAGRVQHIHEVIKPALVAGTWVVCDRFTDASFAYQGYGRGLGAVKVQTLVEWALEDFQPHLTLLLDMPVDAAFRRVKKRGPVDRIESEKIDFFTRVREGYLTLAKQHTTRYRIIDAAQALEKIASDVKQIINACLTS